ncbi:Thiomorpholine-carboxylate dehydrogenase OS=Homo sapiens GN=CRYM PE=1 SV=1 [Rhizoctonia solani AG-1 IB]|uniref:Ornithine cyclodeaminase n=1 Tax=Thanatephorus cucumeris (strain AG1-IB / isolate 7/3/14) TaxID=1108050 RepID=M5C5V1_THACB|nr:ornithine cyclodeaminase [Rhizoctonia solani AG-1 IB]CEL58504.1 Thiomorpholine-carboxylate dehydrogenase OS=Homo sapiens GN=CRYM PE=1 SV=1 [Rhizoctonia solani AG-1 IB]
MKSELLILSADDIEHLVHTALKPEDVVQCMSQVFEMVSGSEIGEGATDEHDRVQQPPRLTTLSPEHTTLYMPCRLPTPATESSTIHSAIKVVSVSRTGGGGGIPGTTLVLDEKTGGARAVVNSRALTALRNAAGSVLATRLIGPKSPTRLVLFGAGLQIKHHARLFIQSYPTITHCTIINRTLNDRFTELLADLTMEFLSLRLDGLISGAQNIEPAVREADVICTATSSTQPLFDSAWVKDGAHVNLIGSYTPAMREVDPGLIKRTGRRVLVDETKSCLVESGELIDATITEEELVEIGTLVRPGAVEAVEKLRQAGNVTVYKSVGVGAQDVAVAGLMVELAEKDGRIGTRVAYD